MVHLCLQFGIVNAFSLTTSKLAVRALQIRAALHSCPVFPISPPKGAAPGILRGWSWCPRATLTSLILGWVVVGLWSQFLWPASQELSCHCWVPYMIYLSCPKLLHKLPGAFCPAVCHHSLYLLGNSCWMFSLNKPCTFLHSSPIITYPLIKPRRLTKMLDHRALCELKAGCFNIRPCPRLLVPLQAQDKMFWQSRGPPGLATCKLRVVTLCTLWCMTGFIRRRDVRVFKICLHHLFNCLIKRLSNEWTAWHKWCQVYRWRLGWL